MSDRIEELRKKLNKKEGFTVAHDLSNFNPSDVKKWIPTGSRWLDSIIANKEALSASGATIGGIPAGKIVEIAGEESAGKSYMAAQIATNAQKMGFDIVYFDTERAVNSTFWTAMGMDLSSVLYLDPSSVESVVENIETLLKENEKPMLFVWDSLGMTPAKAEAEIKAENIPTLMAIKARIMSVSMARLVGPISDHGSTLLIVNQLMDNIAGGKYDPFETPGGKKVKFAYSLRLWLTGSHTDKSSIEDASGTRIGINVRAKIKKSRFGTEGRSCEFKILWGGPTIAIQDKESWLEAIKLSTSFETAGAWYKMKYADGTEAKFQGAGWLEKLENDEKFRNRVIELLDECLIK